MNLRSNPRHGILLLTALAGLVAGCAVNPATGKRQIILLSEAQEIQMGQEADPQIAASIGFYEDEDLQAYVRGLGLPMAAGSERPGLPWSFKVVDDPVVNAFAVPGGFIYVTRGILATLNSEAELAGVLGHEIGHVTARHSASQISRQQLQQLGLGVGMILSEGVQKYADLIQSGIGVLNLKYSRGDESEADRLGFRYMTAQGYDPHALIGVFETLALVSGGGDGRIPEWQLTHPYPENREAAIRDLIRSAGGDVSGRVEHAGYIQRLDGIVYGENPREGYFEGEAFSHPDLAFRIDFPAGWKGVNQRTAVGAVSPSEDALLVLSLEAGAQTPSAALSAFLGQEGIQGGRLEETRIGGFPAARATFSAPAEGGEILGEAAFVAYESNLYRILGYGSPAGWSSHGTSIRRACETFRKLTDPAALSVEPARLEIVRLPSAMTFAQFLERYPSDAGADEVGLINRVEPQASLEAGRLMKRVVGGPGARRPG